MPTHCGESPIGPENDLRVTAIPVDKPTRDICPPPFAYPWIVRSRPAAARGTVVPDFTVVSTTRASGATMLRVTVIPDRDDAVSGVLTGAA